MSTLFNKTFYRTSAVLQKLLQDDGKIPKVIYPRGNTINTIQSSHKIIKRQTFKVEKKQSHLIEAEIARFNGFHPLTF